MRKIFTNIRVWFLAIVILMPLILALPRPISWKPFHFKEQPIKVDLMNGNPEKKETSSIPFEVEAIGGSILASLLGIDLETMPTYICARNSSRIIYLGHREVDPSLFLEEGGSADIYIDLNQDNKNTPVRVPLASSTCPIIVANIESGLGNEIVWQYKPTAHLENIFFSLSDVKIGFKFKLWVYLKNYLLVFCGLIIFVASVIQCCQFLKRLIMVKCLPIRTSIRRFLSI